MKINMFSFLTFAITTLVAMSASAQDNLISFLDSVTAQVVEEGKRDKSRAFIFEFFYLAAPNRPYHCSVSTIIVNNLDCQHEAEDGQKAIWLKQEYASRDFSGENFTCTATTLGRDRYEFIVNATSGFSTNVLHRMILSKEKSFPRIVDYKGSVSNLYGTKKIDSATYEPIEGKGELSGRFERVDLGCSRLTVPAIR